MKRQAVMRVRRRVTVDLCVIEIIFSRDLPGFGNLEGLFD